MRLVPFLGFALLIGQPSALRSQESVTVPLIAISVRDIDSTTAWYGKYLGFTQIDKKDFPDYKMSIVILQKESVRLELVQHKESVPVSSLLPKLDNPALIQGYGKVAYEVNNIEQIVRMMKADSVRFILELQDDDIKSFEGYKSCIVLDNNGNWVQLFQRK